MASDPDETWTMPVWRNPQGEVLDCDEKVRILEENIHDIALLVRDVLEDGVLMGCDEKQLRQVIQDIVRHSRRQEHS